MEKARMFLENTTSVKDSIATKLLATVFSFYLIITVTLTGIHMVSEYYNAKTIINQELEAMGETFLSAISNAIWSFDDRQLQSIASGFIKSPLVVGVQIEQPGRSTITLHDPLFLSEGELTPERPTVSTLFGYSTSIAHDDYGQKIQIGKLSLYSNTNIVLGKVWTGYIFIVINAILKTAALWGIFLWISRKLLSRPLAQFTTTVNQVNLENLTDVKIDIPMKGKNEFKILERAFNEMIQKLSRARAELQVKEDALKQADQLKDEFLANTSHELKTPLHGIIGLCETLPQANLETQQNTVQLISKSARRLSHLVNDILDFSRIRNQDLRLMRRSVEVQSVVHLVCQLCETSIGQKSLKLLIDVPQVPLYVNADEERLQQVLINLLSNAIKFTHSGHVSVKAVEQDDHVCLSVSDTGIGIPPEKQTEIFKPFIQADGSISRTYGGTGLGLAISQQLIVLHGGQLELDSAPGKGTTISFQLAKAAITIEEASVEQPTVDPPPTDDISANSHETGQILDQMASTASQEKKNSRPLSPDQRRAKPLLLIVDDEPINLKVLETQLIQKEFWVHSAQDGIQALEMVERELPDLVLLDLMMPRMNGYEACRKLRESYSSSELPIIMLTAKGQTQDLVLGLRAGANDYLTKPFYQEELLSRIQNQLQQKKTVQVMQKNQRLEWEIQHIKQTELSLRLSIQRLSQILDTSEEAFLVVDGTGCIIFCSDPMAHWLGYSKTELLNHPLSLIVPTSDKQHPLRWPLEAFWLEAPQRQVPLVLQQKNEQLLPCEARGIELEVDEATWIFTFTQSDTQETPTFSTLEWASTINQNRRRIQRFIDIFYDLPQTQIELSTDLIDELHTVDQSLEKLHALVRPTKQDQLFEKLLVQVMNDAVMYWETETKKNLIELAEASGLWAVNLDGDRFRARTLERYLEQNKLPKKPRWRNVLKTAHFVLAQSTSPTVPRRSLETSLNQLLQLIHQRNLSPPLNLTLGN